MTSPSPTRMLPLPPALRAFAPYPDFLRLLGARVMGGSATQMLMVAAAWQMYDLTGSAWDLGLVGLYQFAPVLVFTLLAGHVADRYPRGRIMASAMTLQWLSAALLLAATLAGALSRELIFGISVALGSARAFQMPAQQSLVGALLPHGLLSRGTAMSSAGNQISVIGGPALAGLLYMGSGVAVYATGLVLLLMSIALALRMLGRPARMWAL